MMHKDNTDNGMTNTEDMGYNLLDRYFETVQLQEVDTAQVIELTHMKMTQKRLLKSRNVWRIVSAAAVAACIILILTVNLAEINKSPANSVTAEIPTSGNNPEAVYKELTVPVGQRMTLMLSDGSKLIANSRSRIRYPSHFNGDTRHIHVEGEVYLEVTEDTARPFVVSCDGFNVKVYGTTFCISNYNPTEASIILVEGSVGVSTQNEDFIRMHPKHKVTVNNGAIDDVREVETSHYTCWTQGKLLLENKTLGEIIGKLNTYYNVDMEVHDSLKNCTLYGSLDLKDDIKSVLKVLSTIIPMDIKCNGNNSTFHIAPPLKKES